jgi:hypothetical protein
MAQQMLQLKHWLTLSGVASLGVLCLLAATSTGLANRKTPEDLADLRTKHEVFVAQGEYKDQLLHSNNASVLTLQIEDLDIAELAQELQEIESLKRFMRQRQPVFFSVIESQKIKPEETNVALDYPDLLLRLKAHQLALSMENIPQPQIDLELTKIIAETNKSQQTRDEIWIARWRLIHTLGAHLSPASYEAVLFSLLLAHYLQGHLEAGWAEVKVWLEVLVRHGLAEKDALKLGAKLDQAYRALSQ